MAQVTINVPTVPKDWHSTAVGLLGSIALLLKEVLATGTVTLETVAIAVFVAVVCYFIPGKDNAKDEAKLVEKITGIVNASVAAKLPPVLTKEHEVSELARSAVDVAVKVTGAEEEQAAAPIPRVAAG